MSDNSLLTGFYTYDQTQIPYNLKAISLDCNNVKLSWNQPSSTSVSGYRIYRASTDDEIFYPIAFTVGAANTTYIDSGLEGLRFYYYRITSIY